MNPLARLGIAARRGFGRVTPDPFVLASGLTMLTLVLALLFGEVDAGPTGFGVLELSFAWTGAGVWNLLAFSMQACVMLVLGTALAETPVFQRLIRGLVGLARTPRALVGLTAGVAVALGLVNWSLSLIGGALLAKAAGNRAREEGWSLHYPILCAAAYAGLMVWHGGLSGTAPLKVTNASDVAEVLGADLAGRVGVIPLDRTLFSSLNLVVSGGLLVMGPLLFMALTPPAGSDVQAMTAPAPRQGGVDDPADASDEGWIDRIESSAVFTRGLALMMFAGLGVFFVRRGVARLDLNTVNLTLWCLAMVLHRGPRQFLAACQRGIEGCAGILIQFPLYAGIMGLMKVSGLSVKLTALVAGAGANALAGLTFLSAGVVNLFVPSGGGQWAVQGPIIVEAALRAGVSPETVLMAMAYGDQWTNMLQPFWALPLLAITGVRARDIVGYTALWMLAGGAWMLGALLLTST